MLIKICMISVKSSPMLFHMGHIGQILMLIKDITTHLLSIERAHWLKMHDMFNARDAKSW